MRKRPKSIYVDKDGMINWKEYARMVKEDIPETPDRLAWDKEYADLCDKQSELYARATGKKHWGRWYLTKTDLVTTRLFPKNGKAGFDKFQSYPISLSSLFYGRYAKHMTEKNWIGDKGHEDLRLALEELAPGCPYDWEKES